MTFLGILRVALLTGSLGGLASAQDVAANQKSPLTPGSARSAPAVEPAELSGMLDAQNQVRDLLGLDPLSWSSDLSAAARVAAAEASEGACSMGSSEKAVRGKNVSLYWATGIRRFGGDDSVQDISPSYVVSRWREGRSGYDPTKTTCRGSSSECAAYARMVAPTHAQLGCAHMLCSSQAQVWVCKYGE